MGYWTIVPIWLWSALILWRGSDSGLHVDAALLLLMSGCGLAIWWYLRFRQSLRQRTGEQVRHGHGWVRWAIEPCLLIVVGSLWLSGTAFCVRFHLSQPALEQYVYQRVQKAESASAYRVGLFSIQETEVLPGGVVRLITCHDGMLDDAGVVYCRTGRPPELGEDTYRYLWGPWWHWRRSW